MQIRQFAIFYEYELRVTRQMSVEPSSQRCYILDPEALPGPRQALFKLAHSHGSCGLLMTYLLCNSKMSIIIC